MQAASQQLPAAAPPLAPPAFGAPPALPPAAAPPLPPAAAPPLAPVVPSPLPDFAKFTAPPDVIGRLSVLCGDYHFTLGPLIDFPAIGRKLIRVKYTTGSTKNYFFVYLSQSEGMFRVLFVLDPSGSIEKGVDYVQATLEEICLQYHLNKLYNELLKLIPTMIKSARDLIYFIHHMSEIDPYQYIKIHPGFNPVFQKVHSDYSSAGLNYPLMCYFTTVGVHYGSGFDKVNSFSDIVYDRGGTTKQNLVFLQNGFIVTDATGQNRFPPVLHILTGADLEKADYELCAKYKKELMSFDTNVKSLSDKDPTEMYAHVPLDTVGWNLGSMTTNMRLRSRLLPDNLELLASYVIQFLNECLPMCKSFNSVAINEDFKTTMLTLLKKLTLPSWVSSPSDLFTMDEGVYQKTLEKMNQEQQVLLSDILNLLYPIRSKLRTYIDLIRQLRCEQLTELEKYSEFIKYLKTCVNPIYEFINRENLNLLLKEKYNIDNPDTDILKWIEEWVDLYTDYSTRNVANEVLQRVLKEKNLTYGNSKIDLLNKLIDPDKFNPNNNTNFEKTTMCDLIFLIGSVIIIFQDKIKFEMGLTGSSSYLDTYKSILSKFLVDDSLLEFLKNLLSSPGTVVLGGGGKRDSNGEEINDDDDEDDENDNNTPAPTNDSKIEKEKLSKKQAVVSKLQPLLDLIKSRRHNLQMEISSNSDFNTTVANYVVAQIQKEETDDKFKEKLNSFLVKVSSGNPTDPPKVTDDLSREVKKFQNYASNKYYTMSMFDLHYEIDTKPESQLYCYGTIGNNTQFHKLTSPNIHMFPTDFLPEQFKTSFDNWYFDVPLSGGNLPHNATVFTISVIYALEITYTTVDEQDLKRGKPSSLNDGQGGGATKKKICILFTVSSTIVLPLPIPLTVTASDIKFAIQNQITPIACIVYTQDDNKKNLNINDIEKTLLGTYRRFAIYGSVFAGKPMDYVIGRHAQVPPYFKMDPFFSKYLKVCEHYCTTAPFYNWCKHKPYSDLEIGDGLEFAQYFNQLFSVGGDYASLQVKFVPSVSLDNILKSRTTMIEKITRLFTLDCDFFVKFNDEQEKIEEEKLCKQAENSTTMCSIIRTRAPVPTLKRNRLGGGGNRTFKRHPRDKHKRKHNDDGLTKHKTSNKLRRKKSVKN
jgi:hypothetical protein